MNEKGYESLCRKCLPVVRKASEFIKGQLGKVAAEDIEAKEKNSLVSYVDKTAEKMLVEGLHKLLPEAEFLTEEATVDQKEGEVRWIIDPLDGTTNFLHSIPHFAVSIALEIKDKLVLGIVEEVNTEEVFYAWKEGGAYLNGQRISVRKNHLISEAIVGTGFPYSVKDSVPMLAILNYWINNARGIRRKGSAAMDLAYVACGRYDFYYETSINAWDVAGGAVLVKEAGGKVVDLEDNEDFLHAGNIIASNGHLHDEIVKRVSDAYAAISS